METNLFLLASLPALLYALIYHADNILLEKYFTEHGAGTIVLFSALVPALALPIIAWQVPSVIGVSYKNIGLLFLVGGLNVALLWCYLQALVKDEPMVVVLYYQLVPVIGLVFGYTFLSEKISSQEAWAMVVIIAGAISLTVVLDERKVRFRLRTALYMTAASVCWAAESTFFKVTALEESWLVSFFWQQVASVCIGVCVFAAVPRYRHSFVKAVRSNSGFILLLNILNEAMYVIASLVAAFVLIQIPVAKTLLMNSFQPIFVLVVGVMLTLLFPKLEVQHINKNHVLQKVIAVVFTIYGGYLLKY